jgi:hypothetical protein
MDDSNTHKTGTDDYNDICVYQVYDGATTSGLRLHPNNGFTFGSSPRITLTASSGEMLIRFVTDALHSSRGWNATFSAGRDVQLLHCLQTEVCLEHVPSL